MWAKLDQSCCSEGIGLLTFTLLPTSGSGLDLVGWPLRSWVSTDSGLMQAQMPHPKGETGAPGHQRWCL